MESMLSSENQSSGYPPYNIEKHGEHAYRVVMAVAGFDKSDLDITTRENQLIISADTRDDGGEIEYLHRGIAGRAFERRFRLAEHVKVRDARLENGLLYIELERVIPEDARPRSIEIKTAENPDKSPKEIEGEARKAQDTEDDDSEQHDIQHIRAAQ
jgi:molecular chaperone IbpA